MGGMGEVYRARDLTLSRDVALKVLPESLFPDIARLKRFQQEALAVSALNIVSVFDFAENDGSPYVIHELLSGDTLRTVLKGGPLPLKRCLDLAGQIAAGLAAAHAAGITHRVIKPENLMITPGDRIKIIDFGLARVTAVVAGDEATHSMEMTAPGIVVGTVSYMSLEQVRGAPVDFRSDQFSLGLVLGEMLSGKKTFHCVTTADTLAAILTETANPAAASGVAAPAPVRGDSV